MMSTIKIGQFLCLAIVFISFSFPASAQNNEDLQAPFGLAWGMSTKEVAALGVELTALRDAEGASYSAKRLPKILADVEAVRLNFGFDDRLFKITAVSRDYKNDPYGIALKDRYQQLKSLLGDKYGKGSSIERLGKSIYSEPRHFIYGLYSGENWWLTTFENEIIEIELSARGSSSDVGYWVVIYAETEMKKTFEQALSDRERGAL